MPEMNLKRWTGVVQDKLFLPGIIKLKRTIETGFFGKILSIRGEFGYWVFDGKGVAVSKSTSKPSASCEKNRAICLDRLLVINSGESPLLVRFLPLFL